MVVMVVHLQVPDTRVIRRLPVAVVSAYICNPIGAGMLVRKTAPVAPVEYKMVAHVPAPDTKPPLGVSGAAMTMVPPRPPARRWGSAAASCSVLAAACGRLAPVLLLRFPPLLQTWCQRKARGTG